MEFSIEGCKDEMLKHIKEAEDYENNAKNFEKAGNIEKAAKSYYDAAEEYFHATFAFGLIEHLYEIEEVSKEEYDCFVSSLQKKECEFHLKSADTYKRAAKLYEQLKQTNIVPELYGKVAKQYYSCFSSLSTEEREKECSLEGSRVYSSSETLPGKIEDAYTIAGIKLHNIGEKHEEKREFKSAAFYYGLTGDAYLSIAIFHEKLPKTYLFYAPSTIGEYYFYAAECYTKAGELSRKTGIPTVIVWGRELWRFSMDGINKLFKDSGEYISPDDIERAVVIYNKAKEIFMQQGNKEWVNKCSKKQEELRGEYEIVDTKAYKDIALFEPMLREFIVDTLSSHYGDWKKGIPPDLIKKWTNGRNSEIKVGIPAKNELIEYANYGEYEKIILDNWDIFKEKLKDKGRAKIYLEDLNQILRRPTMHIRQISYSQIVIVQRIARWFTDRIKK